MLKFHSYSSSVSDSVSDDKPDVGASVAIAAIAL